MSSSTESALMHSSGNSRTTNSCSVTDVDLWPSAYYRHQRLQWKSSYTNRNVIGRITFSVQCDNIYQTCNKPHMERFFYFILARVQTPHHEWQLAALDAGLSGQEALIMKSHGKVCSAVVLNTQLQFVSTTVPHCTVPFVWWWNAQTPT